MILSQRWIAEVLHISIGMWTQRLAGLRLDNTVHKRFKDAEEFSSPVILFPNTGDRDNTVLVIEDIIKALKNKGYKFGSSFSEGKAGSILNSDFKKRDNNGNQG